MVPLVAGPLGTPAKAIEKRMKTIAIETKITALKKTCLDTYQQNPPKSS